jgi:flagellar FliL protein
VAKKEEVKTKPGSSFKKMLVLGLIGLLVMGGGAGAALYFGGFLSAGAATAQSGDEDTAPNPIASNEPPNYLTLDPPFIVNFGDEAMLGYLQVGVAVMTRDQAIIQQVTNNLPHIRNNLIMLFGNQDQNALNSTEGKETLRRQTLEEIQSILQKEIGKPGVEDVFFTSFVMQ